MNNMNFGKTIETIKTQILELKNSKAASTMYKKEL